MLLVYFLKYHYHHITVLIRKRLNVLHLPNSFDTVIPDVEVGREATM